MNDNQQSYKSPSQTPSSVKQEETNYPFTSRSDSNLQSKYMEGGPSPRSYLDSTVVPTLLEGMKLLVTEKPDDPLAYLGRFLISRSNEGQQ